MFKASVKPFQFPLMFTLFIIFLKDTKASECPKFLACLFFVCTHTQMQTRKQTHTQTHTQTHEQQHRNREIDKKKDRDTEQIQKLSHSETYTT